ncbi:MAG: dicarboxylate/amino acid:cation symporter [Candidatus Omnitrophica bacterium]|nr:dicarboxylate/amino acid:cation symporter [Candidatus Omnitrophota bacterium]
MKTSLNTQILAGAVLGIVGGFFLRALPADSSATAHTLYFASLVAGIFIGLLKMILIPLIFLSIATGVANLQAHADMKRVWTYTLLYFFIASSLALVLGLAMVNIFKPGMGIHLDMFKAALTSAPPSNLSLGQFVQMLVNGLFVNPIEAMAKGEVLPTVVFAMAFGIGMAMLEERVKTLRQLLNESLDIIMRMVSWIMRLAPLGIMALLIKLVATQNTELLSTLIKFVGVVVGSTLIHGFFTLPLLLWLTTRVNPIFFLVSMRDSLITAFSTSSSSATMPVTLRCVTKNLKADKRIAGFVIPLGTTINMDGTAMYEAIAAVFVANLAGIELNVIQQVIVFWTAMLASIGAPGIPSAGMVTMIMVLQSVGLPVEAIALLIPIDRPLDTIRTVVNVEGDAVGTLIVQKLALKNDIPSIQTDL